MSRWRYDPALDDYVERDVGDDQKEETYYAAMNARYYKELEAEYAEWVAKEEEGV